MKRGSKVTLYELMQRTGTGVDAETRVPAGGEPQSRVVRMPVGFLYVGVAVALGLALGGYFLGQHQGAARVEAEWARDRIDSMSAERVLLQTSEVDTAPTEPITVVEPAPSSSVGPGERATTTPPAGDGSDPRVPGLNYYVICHPSRSKVDELLAFCRSEGLEAHLGFNLKGDPKIYVTPGFRAGEGSSESMVALRARIRSVGILWNRRDPGQNSDFSTHYPEKHAR